MIRVRMEEFSEVGTDLGNAVREGEGGNDRVAVV